MSNEKDFDPKKFSEDLRDRVRVEINDRMNGRDDQGQPRRRGPVVIGIHLGKGSGGCQNTAQWGLIWGVIVAMVGVVILLDNMGILAASQVFRFWPMLLIIPGILNLTTQRGRLIGILLVGFGAALQLHELGIARFSWGVIWGLVWIAVGVLILWSSLEARNRPPKTEAGGDPRTRLNEVAIFGGVERRITTQDFQGGAINAIFGGVELDLSEAGMQSDEVTLDVNAIFGGVEIRVPYEWQVVSRGAPVFGGFVDKTRLRRTEDPSNTTRKMLVLTGAAIFGGVEIKN